MFQKKLLKGEYKEKIKESFVEDIEDHAEDAYFDGFVPFEYDNLRNHTRSHESKGIKRTIHFKTLETSVDLPFKNGDIIRIDGIDLYEVDNVDKKIPDKYKSLVAMNPGAKSRYEIKVITLYETS